MRPPPNPPPSITTSFCARPLVPIFSSYTISHLSVPPFPPVRFPLHALLPLPLPSYCCSLCCSSCCPCSSCCCCCNCRSFSTNLILAMLFLTRVFRWGLGNVTLFLLHDASSVSKTFRSLYRTYQSLCRSEKDLRLSSSAVQARPTFRRRKREGGKVGGMGVSTFKDLKENQTLVHG